LAPASQRPQVVPSADIGKLRDIKLQELGVRFVFGAAISVAAGLLGKAVGVRFGGAFLAFPAILPASLTLIQNKEGTRKADRNAIGAVLGGLALAVFAGVGEAGFGHVSPALVLIGALAAWAATSFLLYALLAFFLPEACDEHND
jgi:hypothetical protein